MDKLDKVDCIHRINLSAATEIDFMKNIYEKMVTKICAIWFSMVSIYPSIYINTYTNSRTVLEYISQY